MSRDDAAQRRPSSSRHPRMPTVVSLPRVTSALADGEELADARDDDDPCARPASFRCNRDAPRTDVRFEGSAANAERRAAREGVWPLWLAPHLTPNIGACPHPLVPAPQADLIKHLLAGRLDGPQAETEAQVADAVARAARDAEGGARAPGAIDPRAAAHDAEGIAFGFANWILDGCWLVAPLAVSAPFPHISVHLGKAPRIRGQTLHIDGLAPMALRRSIGASCMVAEVHLIERHVIAERELRRRPSSARILPFRLGRKTCTASKVIRFEFRKKLLHVVPTHLFDWSLIAFEPARLVAHDSPPERLGACGVGEPIAARDGDLMLRAFVVKSLRIILP